MNRATTIYINIVYTEMCYLWVGGRGMGKRGWWGGGIVHVKSDLASGEILGLLVLFPLWGGGGIGWSEITLFCKFQVGPHSWFSVLVFELGNGIGWSATALFLQISKRAA